MTEQPNIVNDRETKQYESGSYSSTHGRSSIRIKCPFCDTTVRAYVWSLRGSGKKCPECGAIHNGWGSSTKKVTP